MSDDIVTRLRDKVAAKPEFVQEGSTEHLLYEAADEIERLRQENKDILATIPHIITGVQNGAADEIERLQAEVAVITRALRLACDDLTSFESDGQMPFDDHLEQIVSEYIDEASRD